MNDYDFLKYSTTGIASPDMSAYDKMRAIAMGGAKYPVTTITGVPPLSFKADGKPLVSWSMLGNGSQSGTPTPSDPITPEFCGKLSGSDWTNPITCAGQTVPVYLGEVQTVRRVKKLVLDGTEDWNQTGGDDNPRFYTFLSDAIANSECFCSHFVDGQASLNGACDIAASKNLIINNSGLAVNVPGFKSYLADQYAAGTPVTVWYVLATPDTGIVNEPLCKIGDYADELHSEDAGVTIPTVRGSNTLTVDTELQPSSVSITGHIKPST